MLGTLAPVIGLVQVGMQARADRYMYLPLIGASLAVAWGTRDLLRGRRFGRNALAAAGMVSLAALAACSWLQLAYWRNTEARHARQSPQDIPSTRAQGRTLLYFRLPGLSDLRPSSTS